MPIRSGSSLIAQLVAAGEAPMGSVNVHTMERMKLKGAPVDWVATTDPIVVSLHPMGLSIKPAHPNAGKLFIDFVLSKDGQQVILDVGRTSPRPGMDPRVDGSKLKLYPTRPELADRYPQYEKEYRQIFGQ
jgi:iron(III) transport system substrate-binding protein